MNPSRTIVKNRTELGEALDPPVRARQVSEYLSRGMPTEPGGGYCVETCQTWVDSNIREAAGNHSRRSPHEPNLAAMEFERHREEYREAMSGFSTGWNCFVMPAIGRIIVAIGDRLNTAVRREIVAALKDATRGMRKAWGGMEDADDERDLEIEFQDLVVWARGGTKSNRK